MGAWRSLWRVSVWVAAVVWLSLSFSAWSETRTVLVQNTNTFQDTVNGNNITRITMGDTVTWSWGSGTIEAHTSTSGVCPPCVPDLKWGSLIQTTGTFSHTTTFAAPGTHEYFCQLHGFPMVGTVIVERPLHHFEVSAPATSTAGTAFDITATAKDQFNNTITGYTGTVQFTSNDPLAILPPNSALVLNTGTATFSVTLRTSGSRSITVNDVVTPSITGTDTVTVSAAAANHLALIAPATVSANGPFLVNVTARDQFNNTATGYGGTVQFSSSDAGAILPVGANPLISGTRNFDVTLANTGARTLTVTDAVDGALTDTENINVSVACSTSFSNPAAITISDAGAVPPAAPYPSTIRVAGLKQMVAGLTVTINGLNHARGGDIDVLLAGPGGTPKMVLLSDSGGDNAVTNTTITLDDAAPSLLPDVPGPALVSGTFKPTNNIEQPDAFASPAPAGPYSDPAPTGTATLASTFNGIDPNGDWNLYIRDDLTGQVGMISGGWSLTFAPPPRTFCNQGNITIPLGGASSPYPSTIEVSGLDGTVRNVSLRLDGMTHRWPTDIDMLIVGPLGGANPRMVVLSDAGGGPISAQNMTVTLDDSATDAVPEPLVSGVFRPFSDGGAGTDGFPPDAPQPPPAHPEAAPASTATLASAFAGINPNGTWKLYINDDVSADGGTIARGWALSFDIKPNTTTALTSTSNPGVTGPNITITANVTSTALGTPTGTVSLTLNGSPFGTLTLVNGTASQPIGFPVGTFDLVATYSGDANFNPSTSATLVQVVERGPTTTTVISAPNPSTFGQDVTFTATISELSFLTLTGTVTFMDGAATLGTAPVDPDTGVAFFTTNAIGGGSRSITAEYGGDSNFLSSTSPAITQTVDKRTPSTSLFSFQSSPTTFGEEVTFHADVTATVMPPAASPTGTVTFKDGAATLGTIVLSSGAAQFSISTLAGGSHNITAVYNGDGNYNTQTSNTLPHDVNPADTSTALASSLPTSTFGQPVTFTATVTSSVGTPVGTVTFMDGATPLGAPAALNGLGIATLTTPSLTTGTHFITAIYNGNGSFGTSTSPAVAQNVNQSATTMVVTAAKETSVFREAVTFTVTVDSTTSGTPTGSVTFFDGTTELGSPSLDGVGEAALTVTGLAVGKHEITAQYAGDSNFLPHTSLVLVHYRSPKPR